MAPYYILRLLPPLGVLNKYQFTDLPSLCECIARLYESLNISSLDLNESERAVWRKHSLELFCESLLITRVDPNVSDLHKHFTNLESGRRARLYTLPTLSEIREEIA